MQRFKLKKEELTKHPVLPELTTASTILSFNKQIDLFIEESGFVFVILEGLSLESTISDASIISKYLDLIFGKNANSFLISLDFPTR